MKQLLLLLALISPSFAQLPVVDYAGMFFSAVQVSPGQAIRKVPTLPATCTAVGSASSSNAVLYQGRVYQCTGNAWSFAVGQTVALTAGRVPFVTTNGVLTDSANWTFTTAGNPNFFLQSANAAHVAAVFRGAASQSANIVEVQSSAGAKLFGVTPAGAIAIGANTAIDATGVYNRLVSGLGKIWVGSTGTNYHDNIVHEFRSQDGLTQLFRISNVSVTVGDGIYYNFGTTTGTMIGATTSQKLAFYGRTPIVQPSSIGQTAGFTAGSGTAAFIVNVGTGGTATDIVLAMPTANAGWICHANNITAAAANRADTITKQTASTTTSVTLQNQSATLGTALAFTASDLVRCTCVAY